MRKIVALTCLALIALSAPVYAQSAGSASTTSSTPVNSPAITYQNGLDALDQAPPNDPNNQNGQIDTTTGLLIGGAVIGGGVLAALLLTNKNQNSSVSP